MADLVGERRPRQNVRDVSPHQVDDPGLREPAAQGRRAGVAMTTSPTQLGMQTRIRPFRGTIFLSGSLADGGLFTIRDRCRPDSTP